MKLLSFTAAGRASYGALSGETIIDLGSRTKYPTLRAALAAGAIPDLMSAASASATDFKLSEVTLATPVPDAEKIVCIGINYKGHILEIGRKLPDQPSVFLRLHSSLVPHGAPIIRPHISNDFDYEGELAVVIGKAGRHARRH
jgi:2-keto-4-pentenoate hydratase/2-oxohepta-3-ene-1,7-dioic acid hydratase in catechol pathway